jgi:hypothetical protein
MATTNRVCMSACGAAVGTLPYRFLCCHPCFTFVTGSVTGRMLFQSTEYVLCTVLVCRHEQRRCDEGIHRVSVIFGVGVTTCLPGQQLQDM